MPVTLRIAGATLTDEQRHALALDLRDTINRETHVVAALPRGEPIPGAKGDPVTIGAIVLTLLTSGAAAKMLAVLRSFAERSSSVQIELERADGETMVVRAQNMSGENYDRTLALAETFLGKGT